MLCSEFEKYKIPKIIFTSKTTFLTRFTAYYVFQIAVISYSLKGSVKYIVSIHHPIIPLIQNVGAFPKTFKVSALSRYVFY